MRVPQFGAVHLIPQTLNQQLDRPFGVLDHTLKITPSEATAVVLRDDDFDVVDHHNHQMQSGPYKDFVCFVDGEEEERLETRISDMAGQTASKLNLSSDEFHAMLNRRSDLEYSQLIAEAKEAGTLNIVNERTGIKRLTAYAIGLLTGTVERLPRYRDR